jgi:AraC family transcriptional regulator of adaptative response/methylated-DNA-[protein]-cysteine methyltransferase
MSPRDPAVQVVARACRAIEAHIASSKNAGPALQEDVLTRTALSSSFGKSSHQLDRAFQKFMGVSPRQYADACRIRHLKSRLKKGDTVTTALYDAGYGSSSRLYEHAPAHLGMTPAEYRRGGAGMDIRYTIAHSPLGRLLVAATERGISALYIGDSDGNLEAALHKEYPRAAIRREARSLSLWVKKILAHLRGREPHLDLPTDVQATAFQRRVWEELRRIPYGATKTYSEVARAMGQPTAIRAVARACATNPVSIVVPCHRVIRQSGNLAGYRWGLDRKRALLEQEGFALSDERKQSMEPAGQNANGKIAKKKS